MLVTFGERWLQPARRSVRALAAALALVALLAPTMAAAGLIRDAEIEDLVGDMTTPVFQAAGLSPNGVRVYLVNSPDINAFVAGGANMFVHTGLLQKAERPEEVVGVLAHETGHLAGGHLSRREGAMRRATADMLIAAALGVAAAVAGAPDAAGALIAGGQHVAQANFLKFNRSQETAADQAAVTYLDRIGMSSSGLVDVFRKLEQQNLLGSAAQNDYLSTHPLTRDRITFVKQHAATSPHANDPAPAAMVERHNRSRAKLDGFLDPPAKTLQRYAGDDTIAGQYARTIAHYRLPDMNEALAGVDRLIATEPSNPFFHELKGQMLFENGRVREAIAPYEQSLALKPNEALFMVSLARAQIASGDDELQAKAITLLESATDIEPDYGLAWYMLGVAYGRSGDLGRSNLAFAEHALITRDLEDADLYLHKAENHLPQGGSPERTQLAGLRQAVAEARSNLRQ